MAEFKIGDLVTYNGDKPKSSHEITRFNPYIIRDINPLFQDSVYISSRFKGNKSYWININDLKEYKDNIEIARAKMRKFLINN